MSAVSSTSSTALKRLEQELKNLRSNPREGYEVQPEEEGALFKWTATIQGPPASPYEGGAFDVHIQIPIDYPFKPPIVNFTTKVYHPNIDCENGYIGMSILNNDWSTAFTLSSVLLSLRALLVEPQLEDAVMPEIVHEFESKREVYEETARQWTKKYAQGAAQQAPNEER